jgi:hypothetical protein
MERVELSRKALETYRDEWRKQKPVMTPEPLVKSNETIHERHTHQ